jgi:hypothetical protein
MKTCFTAVDVKLNNEVCIVAGLGIMFCRHTLQKKECAADYSKRI